VSDRVEPAHRLRQVLVVCGVVGVVGAGAWACGVSPEDTPRTVGEDQIPFGLSATSSSTTTTSSTVPRTTPTSTATTAPIETANIYLIRDGHLVPVERATALDAGLSEVISELQEVPTREERQARLRTAIPASAVTVLGIAIRGGTATVDLSPEFLQLLPSPTEQQLAAGQLVMTLTDRGPGIGRVRFTVDGNAVSVPRGDGSAPQQADQSVSRDDYLTLLEPAG
jgi:hypothetical protein